MADRLNWTRSKKLPRLPSSLPIQPPSCVSAWVNRFHEKPTQLFEFEQFPCPIVKHDMMLRQWKHSLFTSWINTNHHFVWCSSVTFHRSVFVYLDRNREIFGFIVVINASPWPVSVPPCISHRPYFAIIHRTVRSDGRSHYRCLLLRVRDQNARFSRPCPFRQWWSTFGLEALQ